MMGEKFPIFPGMARKPPSTFERLRESRLQGYDGLLNSGAFKAGKGINPVKRTPAGVTPAK